MKGVAIGIDLGTSGARAALVDERREPVAFATSPIPAAERRVPDSWWGSLREVIAGLARQASLAEVTGIAVDGTSGTVLATDAGGTPLAPASLYNDPTDRTFLAQVERAAPPDSAARGPTSPLARLLAWRGLPGLAHLLHEADWIAGRLSGQYGRSDWNNALKTGFDPAVPSWPDWISGLDLNPAMLPQVLAPGEPIGRISPRVADALGLPPQIMVVAGTTDGCAAFLATGASHVGEGVTSLGTTLTLKLLSPRPVLAPAYGVYSHRIGALWLAGGASNSGGAALARHFDPVQLQALSLAIDPTQLSPLDYYPLPAPGERFPVADPALQSRELPRPADDAAFLHGLLESIARIEALGYRRLSELGGPALTAVFTVGGGARNRAWCALRGRILGVDMRPPRAHEPAVGTAGLALRP